MPEKFKGLSGYDRGPVPITDFGENAAKAEAENKAATEAAENDIALPGPEERNKVLERTNTEAFKPTLDRVRENVTNTSNKIIEASKKTATFLFALEFKSKNFAQLPQKLEDSKAAAAESLPPTLSTTEVEAVVAKDTREADAATEVARAAVTGLSGGNPVLERITNGRISIAEGLKKNLKVAAEGGLLSKFFAKYFTFKWPKMVQEKKMESEQKTLDQLAASPGATTNPEIIVQLEALRREVAQLREMMEARDAVAEVAETTPIVTSEIPTETAPTTEAQKQPEAEPKVEPKVEWESLIANAASMYQGVSAEATPATERAQEANDNTDGSSITGLAA